MNLGNAGIFKVELKWQEPKVDLDLQCLCVDQYGTVCEAAFFNNLKALGGAVVHSGDETPRCCKETAGTAKDTAGVERVLVDLLKMPKDIKMLIFYCFSFTPGITFQKIPSASASLVLQGRSIAEFPVQTESTGLLFGKVVRQASGDFHLVGVHAPAPPGARNFLDCHESLRMEIADEIPGASGRQKLFNFDMKKGGILNLGDTRDIFRIGLSWVKVGLSWDAGQIDVDASCILFDENANAIETVFFGNLSTQCGAISHSGDNLTGEGDGDDETITVDLNRVSLSVSQIFFGINIYTKNATFQHVKNPQCRIVTGAGEILKYKLASVATTASALIVCRLMRGLSGWEFHALGEPTTGHMWRDTLPAMKRLFHVDTKSLGNSGARALKNQAENESCCFC